MSGAHWHRREHLPADLEDGHLITERVVLGLSRLGSAGRHPLVAL
jgi:hypothetical protein